MKGSGTVTADRVAGTGSLPWSQVGKLITLSGVDASNIVVTSDDHGEVTAEVPVSALGVRATLVVTGKVAVADGKATVTVDKVAAKDGGTSPLVNSLLSQVKRALTVRIQLPMLPYNLMVTSVQPTSAGLVVSAVATNVPLAGGGG
jgi:hypothetical protein